MANSHKGHDQGHIAAMGVPGQVRPPGPEIETIGPNTVSSSIATTLQRPDVALLGATPAFEHTLHVGRPNMPDRQAFLTRINQVLDSGRLSNWGPFVQEFEDRVAEISGAQHCIATCNATIGLELAISGLGMSGDVIVPSFTFIATVHALWLQGVRPVFCDIDPVTHCLDIDCVEAAITSRTTGILGVHLWGNSCANQRLHDLAKKYDLKLLFDAAHSFGCETGPNHPSHLGDAAVYSFHATKCIHSFEGGAIVTNDRELADRLRLMVNFGFAGEDIVAHLGINGKMNEASAAMGLTSLEAMDQFFDHNRANYATYAAALADVPGVTLMPRETNHKHNFQYIVTEVDPTKAGLTRDELISALRLENVYARRYFYPGCHRMQPYAGLYPRAGYTLPVTEAVAERVMVLPTGMAMSGHEIKRLCACIASIVRQAPAVRAAIHECKDPRLPPFPAWEARTRVNH